MERFEQALRYHAAAAGYPADLRIEHWRPDSNRKHRIRQFMILHAQDQPRLVAKVRTDPQDDKLGYEYGVLCELAAQGTVACLKPLAGDGDGFIMPFLPRENLPDAFAAADHAARLAMVDGVVAMILDFHRCTRLARARVTAAILDDVVGAWRPDDAATREALERTPVGAMHGDLGPWNVRSDGNSYAMLDWEDYRPAGIPALDLLNALLTLTLVVHRAEMPMLPEILFRRTFLERNAMTDLLQRGIKAYSAGSGQSPLTCLALVPVYCRAMLHRFEREQRPTAHLFYGPFMQNFALEDAKWLAS